MDHVYLHGMEGNQDMSKQNPTEAHLLSVVKPLDLLTNQRDSSIKNRTASKGPSTRQAVDEAASPSLFVPMIHLNVKDKKALSALSSCLKLGELVHQKDPKASSLGLSFLPRTGHKSGLCLPEPVLLCSRSLSNLDPIC
ncbi:hypothetical protein MPTK1_1g13070 [Marchantia polymorpha subsp. ruderalis]|uniref:Uncharacterized protein n=2 Tax=Marchantia polymorpha TaxID=3197 RepID=A0AAF6APL4_MARPO|nr:hypothetical protein MARPO_0019s0077 [Marchantia polymorpha]BBM98384.1 hypothetical protein Mp_1g13070 [Marchantia polymorpha subsp. ruderalis]|eukprot:PTQ44653.1 hypothetical protein MARPO_0019s0077 [Marchantia polymorpha]